MSGVETKREYRVHYYEVNYRGDLLITSLMNYFGDVSMQQTEDLNVGMEFLNSHSIAWVLYKWDINIKKMPKYNEKVKVKTLAYGIKKFYSYRKFFVMDSMGNTIIEANSVWFLIDTNRRRAIRVPDYMYEAFNLNKEDKNELKIDKIQKVDRIDNKCKFNVRYSDIDTNKHVNNAKYTSWAIESIPRDIVESYKLKNLKVTYEKETSYGETITSCTQIINENNNIRCLHKIEDKDGVELTLLETIWEKL